MRSDDFAFGGDGFCVGGVFFGTFGALAKGKSFYSRFAKREKGCIDAMSKGFEGVCGHFPTGAPEFHDFSKDRSRGTGAGVFRRKRLAFSLPLCYNSGKIIENDG